MSFKKLQLSRTVIVASGAGVFVYLLVACGGLKNDSSSLGSWAGLSDLPFEPIVQLKDFDDVDTKTLEVLTAEQVLEKLRDTEDLYANAPAAESSNSDAQGSEGADSCRSKQEAASVTYQFIGDDTIVGRMKMPSGVVCPGDDTQGTFAAQGILMVRCVGVDLSRFKNVETPQEFEEAAQPEGFNSLCFTGRAAEFFDNLRLEYEVEIEQGQSLHARVRPDGGACRWVRKGDDFELEKDCVTAELSKNQASGMGQQSEQSVSLVNSTRLTAKAGLVRQAGSKDPWFVSGTVVVVINNWSGTITYQGSKAAPRVVLTDSRDGKKIDRNLD